MSEEELPEGWAWSKLPELGEFGRGKSKHRPRDDSRLYGGSYPFVQTGDVARSGGRVASYSQTYSAFGLAQSKLWPKGTVCITIAANIADSGILGFPACFPDSVVGFVANSNVTRPEFIEFFVRTARADLSRYAPATAQKNINLAILNELAVPLPPLPEQRRIADKVEALLAEVNRAKGRLERVRVILRRFRQSVLATACSGKLTEEWRAKTRPEPIAIAVKRVKFEQTASGREATDNVIPGLCVLSVGDPGQTCPEGWAWLPLMTVARLESGHTPSRNHPEYWDGDIPWISLPDAREHHGKTIDKTTSTISDAGIKNSAARLLPRGTICLSRTASVGYVIQLGKPMATSQDFVNWVCSDALVPDFLMYAIMAEGEHIREFGRGSTHTTIYFPEVKALHICLPPVQEQRQIVERIREALEIASSIERRVELASRCAEKLPPTILSKAFSGELVPTEAELARTEGREYEPASELLKRIKNHGEGPKQSPKARRTRSRTVDAG